VTEPPKKREPAVLEKTGTIAATSSVSAKIGVDRGLNELRLAVLGIVVTIGLTVGFGVHGAWWIRALSGLGSFALACGAIRYNPVRRRLMSFMHWLTGS
jgi:hypothetical protein